MKEVAKHLALCPADLHRVEWRDLERLLREAFEGIGFDTVLTRSTKDGGFDLRLMFEDHGRKRTYLVEVKHWSAPSRPGSAILQHFAHVVAREAAECDYCFPRLDLPIRRLTRFITVVIPLQKRL
jgi:hypothetical protein